MEKSNQDTKNVTFQSLCGKKLGNSLNSLLYWLPGHSSRTQLNGQNSGLL